AAMVIARRQRTVLAEDHLGLVEPAAAVVEFRACHRCAAAAGGALGIAEEDRPVLCKAAIGDDVEQTALAARPYVGHALERRRELALGRHDAHAARAFGHQ